jgi:hypothetical protein
VGVFFEGSARLGSPIPFGKSKTHLHAHAISTRKGHLVCSRISIASIYAWAALPQPQSTPKVCCTAASAPLAVARPALAHGYEAMADDVEA